MHWLLSNEIEQFYSKRPKGQTKSNQRHSKQINAFACDGMTMWWDDGTKPEDDKTG